MAIVVGVFRLCIDLSDDKVQNCYLNQDTLDSYDPRIFQKLQNEAGNNKLLHVPVNKIPAYKKFFQFWEDHEVEIDLKESFEFQTTCKFFELNELENKVKSHFGDERKSFRNSFKRPKSNVFTCSYTANFEGLFLNFVKR